MLLLPLAAFFALGAAAASFVGVLVGRLHTGESSLSGRSRCDACGAPLALSALVPVVSFIAQGGRARCCGSQLSPVAPLSELLLGALFALSYWNIGLAPALPLFLLSLSLLAALVLYDAAHQILPPSLLAAFVAASSLADFFLSGSFSAFLSSGRIALLIALFLFLIHVLSRGRAMGFSDAPFALGLSLLVGPAALPGLVFSFWVGAAFGIIVLAGRPAGSRMGIKVPFAPYLAAGFLLAYFTQWNPFVFVGASP